MTAGTIAANDKCILCSLHAKRIATSANLPGLSEIFAGLEGASILGGNTAKTDTNRFSYWLAQPKEAF